MLERAGYGGRLHLSADAEEADGASFVIVQAPGPARGAARRDDPAQVRMRRSETTGPGGFAKGLRTIPVVLDLAELTARRGAPGAWIVDFTNPTGMVTQALLDEGHRALVLCNVAINLQRHFASRFGVEPERVELEHVGLNHLSWERAIRVDGADRLPRAARVVARRARARGRPPAGADRRDRRHPPTTCATTIC